MSCFVAGGIWRRRVYLPGWGSKRLVSWVVISAATSSVGLARAHTFITRGVAEGTVRPRIDKIFTLDQMVEAHRYLESGQQLGKIVMRTSWKVC